MRYLLYLLAVVSLLSFAGCIVPGDVEVRGHEREHWEHGDHDRDWDRR
jgi:hypothetical protein